MNFTAKTKRFLLENSSVNQTITKNTFWLFVGQLISRLLRAIIVIYSVRVLSIESWGAFSFSLGVVTFLTIFSDIGINALIIRQSAQEPELKSQYLATAFFCKLGLLAMLITSVLAILPYITKIPEAKVIIPILIFVFAFDTLRDLGAALSRAMEKMQIEAGLQIFTNFAIAALGLIFLYNLRTSQSLAIGYALGSFLGLIAASYALRSYYGNLFKNFNKNLIVPIFKTAWPFGLLSIMGIIMLNTDIIMLGWLTTPSDVGYYAAAQKLIQLLYVLPTLISISLFPALARILTKSKEQAAIILGKALTIIIILAIPIALLGVIFADFIINLVFGSAYLPAVNSFRILMLSILIVYPSSLLGQAIFAYDRQKAFIGLVVWSALGNVIFNFLLIPKFGIAGAAIATVIVQITTNAYLWKKVRAISGIAIWPHLKNFLKLGAKL